MHLRRNKFQDNQAQPSEVNSAEFNWERKLTLPKEVRDLAAQRKKLLKKIFEIENRLRFGYSEPLQAYKMELVKEDIQLSCKMTEILVTLPGKV